MSRALAALCVPVVALLAGCSPAEPVVGTVGECFQASQLGEAIAELPVVPCEEPHEAEVFAVFDLEYPGAYDPDPVVAAVESACREEFEAFVGRDYETSELDIYYLYPPEAAWDEGHRAVTCAIIAPDWDTRTLTLVTGSLEGANR